MKQLQLVDRIVVEIMSSGDITSLSNLSDYLRRIADSIDDCRKGGQTKPYEDTEILWERESRDNGGFRMGNRSLIRDAYYGAKQTFEVCCVEREDLENLYFDTSKLSQEDMERIAAKAGDLILEGCDYWTGVEEAALYWEVPVTRGNIREHLDDVLHDDDSSAGGVSHVGETLRRFMIEVEDEIKARGITLDDDVSVLDDLLRECGIKPIR